ncbi:MAG TPA: hypothetical protein VH459_00940 [Gaiellales bacterium]|jgi:hypothetical protein
MQIARTFRGRGWTLAQYDELIDRMDLGGHSAPGVLFHWAGESSDGIVAVDVYESREAADRLAQEKVGPIAAELGLSMPEIEEQGVDRILTPV